MSTAGFRTADLKGPAEDAKPGEHIHLAMAYAADNTIRLYRNGRPYGNIHQPLIDSPAARLQTYYAGDAVIRLNAGQGFELAEASLYDSALNTETVTAVYRAGPPVFTATPVQMTAADRDRIQTLNQELAQLIGRLKAFPEPEKAHAIKAEPPPPTHVLIRGDVNRKGERVTPGVLSCLAQGDSSLGLAEGSSEGERRRRIAEWITSANNPLFARVMVNRVWNYHFGTGLVDTPNDFGFNGGRPSHPELLDSLARQFIQQGWSLKKLHREIVLSQTYRQGSHFEPGSAAKDAENRLLWRFPPRRLEGEAVRDSMLAVSGTLNPKMNGPSFRPFEAKPKGAYQNYVHKEVDEPEFLRRTIYRMNVNSAGNPMLESLDCPLPSVKTPKRPSTTTALQSLSLMNSEFTTRQAKALARRVVAEAGGAPAAQIDRAFRLTLGRPPAPDEIRSSLELVGTHGLEPLCWGLFNATEFLYVE